MLVDQSSVFRFKQKMNRDRVPIGTQEVLLKLYLELKNEFKN